MPTYHFHDANDLTKNQRQLQKLRDPICFEHSIHTHERTSHSTNKKTHETPCNTETTLFELFDTPTNYQYHELVQSKSFEMN
jgi:hypothetical protein